MIDKAPNPGYDLFTFHMSAVVYSRVEGLRPIENLQASCRIMRMITYQATSRETHRHTTRPFLPYRQALCDGVSENPTMATGAMDRSALSFSPGMDLCSWSALVLPSGRVQMWPHYRVHWSCSADQAKDDSSRYVLRTTLLPRLVGCVRLNLLTKVLVAHVSQYSIKRVHIESPPTHS